MINFNDITGENIQEQNPHWPQISDCPTRILIADRSRSGKLNALPNLLNQHTDIDKIFLHAMYPY